MIFSLTIALIFFGSGEAGKLAFKGNAIEDGLMKTILRLANAPATGNSTQGNATQENPTQGNLTQGNSTKGGSSRTRQADLTEFDATWQKMTGLGAILQQLSGFGKAFDTLKTRVDALYAVDNIVMPTKKIRLLDLRHEGGTNNGKAGRLEVWHQGEWGTVCDGGDNQHAFDDNDAQVVCRQLGFSGGSKLFAGEYYSMGRNRGSGQVGSQKGIGQMLGMIGSGRIWLGGVNCYYSESSFFDCDGGKSFGQAICAHDEDVFMKCD